MGVFMLSKPTEPNLMGYRIYQSYMPGQYTFGKYSQNLLGEIYCFPNDKACCVFTIPKNADPGNYCVVTAIKLTDLNRD